MTTLTIRCLGICQVTIDNQPLNFDTDKARALLVYLALEGRQAQRREKLAGLFWSDLPEERARHNLRQALSSIRKSLEDETRPHPFLLVQRDSVQINPASLLWVDAVELEAQLASPLRQAVRHSRPCPASDIHPSRINPRRLTRAVALFNGPFLDQLYLSGSPLFEEWASLQREAINQRMIEALALLSEIYEKRGEIDQARQYACQIVNLAPWDETAHRQVMRLFANEGQWSAAQSHFHHLRRYLHEEMSIEPQPETLALFEQIRQHAAHSTRLPPQIAPARHNLTSASTPFIGRADELDQIAAALCDPCCQLLTLLGPGGVGKTRLGLEAARHQVGIFSDGVFFVPMTDLTSPDQLPVTLAGILGFTFFGDRPAQAQLLQFLENKHMLLVLDNFEQLLPLSADGLIAQILQRADQIVILATSRQRLNLQEECLLLVTGLPYQAEDDSPEDTPPAAMQLFAQQAKRSQPGFDLSHPNHRQAAAQICQLVEGLPLAVELAAASLWTRTPEQITSQLNSSLKTLAVYTVNGEQRHHSLRAVFEVSWQLLNPVEQALLAGLSVFRGGFESGMAEKVTHQTAVRLASLLDKSLLRRDVTGRYNLQEAIRQFAAEKLGEDAERFQQSHGGHAQVFAAFLSERVEALKGHGQIQALIEIAQEWENARRAWDWLSTQAMTAELGRSAEAIFHFCNIYSRFQEGIELFSRAEQNLHDRPLLQAKILTYLGALAFRNLSNDLCESAIQQALTLFERQNAPQDQGLCLVYASAMAYRRKDPLQARQYCQKALILFEQIGDEWGKSYASYQLGLLESRAGHMPEAQGALRTSLQAAQAVGDQRRQIGPLNQLGDLACQLGEYLQARGFFEKSLTLSQALGDRYYTSIALLNLGTIDHYAEQWQPAQSRYLESLTISQEIGDLGGQSLVLANLGELALAQRRFSESLDYFQQGLDLANKAGDEWAILVCWINLSDAAVGMRDPQAVAQSLPQAIQMAVQKGEPALILRTLLIFGRWLLLQGQKERAQKLLNLVIEHEATYDEYRQAARQALNEAGLAGAPWTLSTLDEGLAMASTALGE